MNGPTWHIVGIGALGGALAGYFSMSEQSIHLILKTTEQLALYQRTALKVNDIACHPQAIDIEHLDKQPIHYLICTVKAYDITALLLRLKQQVTNNSIIILIHNGLGVLDEIIQKCSHLRIISGVSTIGAYLDQPFSVRAFLTGKIYLGAVLGKFTPEEINTICMAFEKTSLPFEWDDLIRYRMLEKFAVNCCINLLTALFNCKNGGLIQHDVILKSLAHEVATVLGQYGLQITTMELLAKVRAIIESTANNYSSMRQDVLHHKPTELPYLNEHLVKLARLKNINTPVTNQLLRTFKQHYALI